MTDLPIDDENKRLAAKAFREVAACKLEYQAQRRSKFVDWRIWYDSLSGEERAKVDEELGQRCAEIASQFGKSRKLPRLWD
jgi:hypothetical protein